MESSNYTEPFFGILCLGKEDQTSLCVFGWESQKCWSKCSGQAHLCLYRMILICFQLPCLETHLTNHFPSIFVLLPQFSVLILMLESLPLIFQPRMPISSTLYWLPIQANLCPTGSCGTETLPLMHLSQRVSFQHSLRPISQQHFPKKLPARMGLQVAWDIQQHLFLLALVEIRCSCLKH